MKASDQQKTAALSFLRAHQGGVLGTISAKGTPSSAFVFYAADDDFNLYIATFPNSRKYENIKNDPNVAFTVASADIPQTLQVEGIAEELASPSEILKFSAELVKIFASNKNYFSPPAKLAVAWGGFKIFKITPSWIRWGDFTLGVGLNTLHQILP